MNYINPTICGWQDATFHMFSENVWGNFIYYSHLLPSLSGLIIAIYIFVMNHKSKPAQALLFTTIMFTCWSLMDLVLWADGNPRYIMYIWSIQIYFDLLVYVGSFYFLYSFLNNKFPSIKMEMAFFTLFIPLLLFSHTALNLVAFDFTNCWREAIEGPLWSYYVYGAELVIALLILFISTREIVSNRKRAKEVLIISTGVLLFLFSFSAGNILGSFSTDWEIGQIGLFGMPVFAVFLGYSLVKFQTFKVKILATEALMAGLFLLILSLLFVRTLENSRLIALATLFLFSILGALLVKSVKKEVKLREQVEQLAVGLERANERLQVLDKQKSEFVSIASHQLRSPLTAIRGYVSMMTEGSFGKLPEKASEALGRIAESTVFMASSIDDFLEVSRIESGNMKYDYKDMNFKEQAEHIVDDLRTDALRRGLLLMFRSDMNGSGMVHADAGKTQQILHNLINNALKYTLKGSVTVYAHDDLKSKKMYVDIIDTGLGLSPESLQKLFGKFARAKVASSANIMGTGLGLFVAREMARAMGGDITVASDGEGFGSTFTIVLPLI